MRIRIRFTTKISYAQYIEVVIEKNIIYEYNYI